MVVPVESIEENVIVIKQKPGLRERWEQGNEWYVWLVKDRYREWPNMFPIPAY